MFFAFLHRVGPQWELARPIEEQARWLEHAAFMDELVDSGFVVLGGPLADEQRVVLVVDTSSAEEARTTLERDPWHRTHLVIDEIQPWTIRLDERRAP